VSGWSSTHGDWAIDPEPLILFTAWLGDADPRLRDEATDWCIRNWRHISKARLKNLLRGQPDHVQRAFGELAATVNEHASTSWPGALAPRPFAVTGRSTRPALDRPALSWLRLRAMFGVGARAEILRSFLSHDGGWTSVAGLAVATAYTKRNVAEECDALERAGVLSVRARGNRFYYALARRYELEAFVGALPHVRPDWVAMLNVTRELVTLESMAAGTSAGTLPVHASNALRRIERDLDALHIPRPPESVRGEDLWPALRRLGESHLGQWSVGLLGPRERSATHVGDLSVALP
jgi:DNA-binding transcriptional ArsR family regulator